jgi:hypothetical protein
MNKFVIEMNKRAGRRELFQQQMRKLTELKTVDGQVSYAYLAGFLESQLLVLACDSDENLASVLEDFKFAIKNLEKNKETT